ncbi:stage V sporulation protein S [Caldanaerobacter subterraneus]|uniref:Uncharacterized protein n=1 Tax=Caldanaerobacter subterraneus subsp. pacificus DSM 12653 TaxID=391606 RepID=A0A0F5PLW8_9THEO|nr:stage V sporulation protein S [Caldanaerobacter subterraneus]KKC29580.1 hypothetical protein CDSM653_01388 [Caldanaerobacter subterraneus subsp. pacificus DSM 12653]
MKAISIARVFAAPNGLALIAFPAFSEIEIYGEMRPALKFFVEPR